MQNKNFQRILFFLFVFCVEFFIGILYIYFTENKFSFNIFHKSSDHHEFFNPINNLIEYGNYSLSQHGTPYAGRLPGYIFPYIIFRILFSESISLYLLGIFQLLIKSASVVYLCEIISKRHGKKIGILCALACIFIPYFWHWDYSYHPNSVSFSVYLLLLCILFDFSFNWKNIFSAGFLLTYLFFIRPFLALYFLPVLLFLFIYGKNNRFSFPEILKSLIVLLIPFLISESIWVYRNYKSFNKIILFQTTISPFADKELTNYSFNSPTKNSILKVRELISCWGGETFWYFPGEMGWLMGRDSIFSFKEYSLCTKMNIDSMKSLRQDIILSYHNNFVNMRKDSLEKIIIEKSERYIAYYKNERPFNYWISSKFRRIKNFIFKNVTQDWPGPSFAHSPILYKVLKLVSAAEYFFLITFFILYIFLKKNKYLFDLITVANIFMLLLTFAFIINASHYSYFITGYAGLLFLFFSSDYKLKF